MTLVLDQYHAATPNQLAHSITTEHPPIDARDTHGPLFAQLDRLRDLWTAAGYHVTCPASGVLTAADAHGRTVKVAIARNTDTHHPPPVEQVTAAALDPDRWMAHLRTIKARTARKDHAQ